MAEVNNNKQDKGVLKNVVLAYAKIAEPSKKYKSEDLEYSVDCIIDKATAKVWNKQFPKKKATAYEVDEFEEKFKLSNPYPDEDEVYVVKLKKGATKDGVAFDAKFRPKVFLEDDEERVDITVSRLIANGTIADVSWRGMTNDFGYFPQLNNIRIFKENFKEYISKGGTSSGDEFDDEDSPKKPVKTEPENENATKARAKKAEEKPTNKPKQEEPDGSSDNGEFDEDTPY